MRNTITISQSDAFTILSLVQSIAQTTKLLKMNEINYTIKGEVRKSSQEPCFAGQISFYVKIVAY